MSGEILFERAFIDLVPLYGACLDIADQRLYGIDDFCPSAVAQSDGQDHFIEMSSLFLGGTNPVLGGLRKEIAASDGVEANPLLDQTRPFRGEVMLQESHEGADFMSWAIPVFLRECVDGQGPDAQFQTQGDHFSDGIDAFTMASDPRKTT